MVKPLVSIIIVDYKKDNPYLLECLTAIQKQTYQNFEVILVTDYPVTLSLLRRSKMSSILDQESIKLLTNKFYGHYVGPAIKRDDGARLAKGEILAFIDDDAFPSPDWLKNMIPHFKNSEVAGVGGPGVTPPHVSWKESASGWASASPFGAGPYLYRFLPFNGRSVDDFPSMNLAVRRSDFKKVGGFDSNFWPGEDTKLCLDLTHKLGKKIVYDPKVLVYHHRRPLLIPHLRQSGNFGLHRGFFARILPKTSLKPIYFLPSLLLIAVVILSIVIPAQAGIHQINSTTGSLLELLINLGSKLLSIYFLTLILNGIWIFIRSHDLFQSLLSVPVIFITHLWYGVRFIQGFIFTDKLTR